MKAQLRVIAPGLHSTVQDRGRPGYQHLGVAESGALDSVALAAANALVGNAPDEAAIEMFYRGGDFMVEADEAQVAVACSAAQIEVLSDSQTSVGRIATMRSVTLKRGQTIRIGAITGGACAYLAVAGGLSIPAVLGSRATDVRSHIGGSDARALRAGDALPLRRDMVGHADRQLKSWDLDPPDRVRVLPGPQRDYFSDAEFESFINANYTVGGNSNRMGLRLSGRAIKHCRGANIVSDATAPGSIQIPGDGQPIVLLADRQTTGGYPKIATVISADIPALGRLRSGASFSFVPVTLDQAVEARRQLMAQTEGFASRLVRVTEPPADLMPRLMDANLISGVIDAAA